VGELIAKTPPLGAAAALRGMAMRADSRDILARYGGPALIVVGENDALTPEENSSEMLNLMSRSRLIVIPDAGHLSNMEAPDAFNRSLDDFLSQL
jgi:pimeloyl-ACP methyl ester carboxylesterase